MNKPVVPKLVLVLKTMLLSFAFCASAFAAGGKVNINTADAAAIADGLVGIGPAKAEAIVEYRKEHGTFQSADQLASVKGIGLATIEKNRDRIEVAAPAKSN